MSYSVKVLRDYVVKAVAGRAQVCEPVLGHLAQAVDRHATMGVHAQVQVRTRAAATRRRRAFLRLEEAAGDELDAFDRGLESAEQVEDGQLEGHVALEEDAEERHAGPLPPQHDQLLQVDPLDEQALEGQRSQGVGCERRVEVGRERGSERADDRRERVEGDHNNGVGCGEVGDEAAAGEADNRRAVQSLCGEKASDHAPRLRAEDPQHCAAGPISGRPQAQDSGLGKALPVATRGQGHGSKRRRTYLHQLRVREREEVEAGLSLEDLDAGFRQRGDGCGVKAGRGIVGEQLEEAVHVDGEQLLIKRDLLWLLFLWFGLFLLIDPGR